MMELLYKLLYYYGKIFFRQFFWEGRKVTDTVSYTPEEVAKLLKITRFTVYEMIKRGDLLAYRIGRKFRVEAPDLDVYIQKSKSLSPASSYTSSHPSSTLSSSPALTAPETKESLSPMAAGDSIIFCGQDVILDIVTRHLERNVGGIRFLRNYVGSMEGLLALYRGTANAVTAHLWDSDSDTYNLPYVRRLLPGHSTVVINLTYRMAGFYVAKGNPRSLTTWRDLQTPGITLVNRERGSGARVLLDEKLKVYSIPRHSLLGYDNEQMSHLAVASTVARGEADVGVGIEKVALQVSGIDFIPLQKERYDLIIRKEDLDRPHFKTLLAILQSPVFHSEMQGLGGYDLTQTGQILAET